MSGASLGDDKWDDMASLGRPVTAYGRVGYFGPNAQFGSSSVPEASSFALLLAGAAPLGLIARKRLRRKS